MLTSRIAIAGGGLERFATEVRNLQRTEVREVEEPFGAGQKGSSAMPHKRNPIRTERITGLARVLRGYAQTGLENIALWHERDISHSGAERVILPDATIGLDYMQHLAAGVASGMTVRADRMKENLELTHGALFSQRALTALVESGMTRDDAYRVVQENAQRAWDTGTEFRDLLAEAAPDLDLDAVFDYGAYLTHIPEVLERLEALSELAIRGVLGCLMDRGEVYERAKQPWPVGQVLRERPWISPDFRVPTLRDAPGSNHPSLRESWCAARPGEGRRQVARIPTR